MIDAGADRPNAALWTVLDVRAVTPVCTVDGRSVEHKCGLCGIHFDAASWYALSVARERIGGAIVPVCAECVRSNWDALRERMGFVAEMLAAAIARTE